MDQGFNDDELADIMNEIESLEQEFTEETQPDEVEAKAEVEEEKEEIVAKAETEDAPQSVEEEIQPEPEQPQAQTEIVEELAQKPEAEIEQAHQQADDDHNVHAIKQEPKESHDNSQKKDWGSTSMDFSVEGNMKMNMFFKVSGKTVHLHVNEGAFEIELEGGMKFSIPVHEQSDKKAA